MLLVPTLMLGVSRLAATVSYTANASQNGVFADFTGVAIGTASATRRVVVGVMLSASGGASVTALTVGGVGATQLTSGSELNNHMSLWIASVPTGTTATISLSTTSSVIRRAIVVWATDNVGSPTPTATTSRCSLRI